jgi:hypothetical protein
MKKTRLSLFFQFFSFSLFAQLSFQQDYYFPHKSGQTTKISQKGDTINVYHCNAMGLSYCDVTLSYKILIMYSVQNKLICKLETLDSFTLTKYPDKKYAIQIFKIIDSNQISLVYQVSYKSKLDMNDFIDTIDVSKKFGLTYFTKRYYDSFSKLKVISNKSEVNEITSLLKTEKYLKIVQLYKEANARDMYGVFITSELLNLSCLEKGFNPLGASRRMNEIMKN